MKMFKLLFLCFCVSVVSVLGDCPLCDGMSRYYEAVGCKIRCKRGVCPTKYTCVEANTNRTVNRQCIYDNVYYNDGDVLDSWFYDRPGRYNVTMKCSIYDNGNFYFQVDDYEPIASDVPFDSLNYAKYPTTMMPYLLDTNTSLTYNSSYPNIEFVSFEPTVESNCVGPSCCQYHDKLYTLGTQLTNDNIICTCKCPPLMSCVAT